MLVTFEMGHRSFASSRTKTNKLVTIRAGSRFFIGAQESVFISDIFVFNTNNLNVICLHQ